VGRPATLVHILNPVLAALLACPWHIVFTTAEWSQLADQVRLVGWQVERSPAHERLVHRAWWHRQSCSVIAPDFNRDEEEEDGSDRLYPAAASCPAPMLGCVPESVTTTLSPMAPTGPPPANLCRCLRC
jgi:hypothetical protein